ncbi:ribosomal protein S18-alanine N-acetyltransferase [Streptomyces sp. A7024]|uniref:Ribosomal protein S18-alanine N-acetyltransferase n=1 Tax=Streptomyces coryli TaxID=1128680 RepID=A0A6G4U7S6_9ACTN|nr:ribosomal protein S18-alanine N-acetyltransferase [Streptomyces coryli]NGN67241.1 ribosomal protein S18-alanine N-acetyltransferase [Streptomyces coryli]
MTPAVTGAPPVTLREMRWWDIEPVLDLERKAFPEDAWSPAMFWSDLAHTRGPAADRRYVVAEEPEPDGGTRIVGYAGLGWNPDTADILTIAAAADRLGTGVGPALLEDLLAAAAAAGCAEVLLDVRVDNHRAQRFYERYGFTTIGVRRGYYQPGNVDAFVMRRTEKTEKD